jgi:hypothetical protein
VGNLRVSQTECPPGYVTGGIAHDFNNLLTAVIGNLELAQNRTGADPYIAKNGGLCVMYAWQLIADQAGKRQ